VPGTLSRADLLADYKASLQDSAKVFIAPLDADFIRHLDVAALDFSRIRRRTLLGEVSLVAGQFNYPAPANLLAYKSDVWSVPASRMNPWDRNYPGRLPDVRVAENGAARELHFSPAPTGQQIGALGSVFKFYYFAAHSIGDTAAATTIFPGDRGLLILRAQAEAMKELSMRNITKPVQMRDGISSGPRNGTPQYLFEVLMKMFEEAK
jgi:hypothetical protein